MRTTTTAGVAILLVALVMALNVSPSYALQCVPYARDNSAISIKGNAWTWWSSAKGVYDRGQVPKAGSVMVFKKHGSMRYGHVAVVRSVEHSRKLVVDHANWGSRAIGGRGRVATDIAIIDVSPRNDWSQVRVWNNAVSDYGRTYPIYGFIYPNGDGRDGDTQAAVFAANAMEEEATGDSVFTPKAQTVSQAVPAKAAQPQAALVRTAQSEPAATRPRQEERPTAATASQPQTVPARAAAKVEPAAQNSGDARPASVSGSKQQAAPAQASSQAAAKPGQQARPSAAASPKPQAASAPASAQARPATEAKPQTAQAARASSAAAPAKAAAPARAAQAPQQQAAGDRAVQTAAAQKATGSHENVDAQLAQRFGSGKYGAPR